MTDSQNDAADRLTEEVAAMRVPAPDGDVEHRLLRIGIALPILGIVLLLITWYQTSGTMHVDEQIPALVSGGLMAILLTMIGIGLVLRATVARTMRFWAARQVLEQQAQTDRLLEAIEGLGGGTPAADPGGADPPWSIVPGSDTGPPSACRREGRS